MRNYYYYKQYRQAYPTGDLLVLPSAKERKRKEKRERKKEKKKKKKKK
jgi:hypothetical protein